MDFMSKEESYADRRELFKNIWETAMHIDQKDAEIMNKPKVIKTLRLDEVDRCVIGKKKHQRIKNLRTVCNKILDFCDRQDADDLFYEQMAAEDNEPPQHKIEIKPKKTKAIKVRRKIMKVKSMFTPHSEMHAKVTTSESKEDFVRNIATKTSRNTSPITFKRTTATRRSAMITTKTLKPGTSPKIITSSVKNNMLGDTSTAAIRRKVVKKKSSKRKKPSVDAILPPGILDWPEP